MLPRNQMSFPTGPVVCSAKVLVEYLLPSLVGLERNFYPYQLNTLVVISLLSGFPHTFKSRVWQISTYSVHIHLSITLFPIPGKYTVVGFKWCAINNLCKRRGLMTFLLESFPFIRYHSELNCFYILAIANHGATNIVVHISFGIARSYVVLCFPLDLLCLLVLNLGF